MMSSKAVIIVITFTVFVGAGFFINNATKQFRTPEIIPSTTPSTTQEVSQSVNKTATFAIYTLGTKRIFTQPMYHNQSDTVFIQSPDPSIIYVKKSNVTWDDFFKTLPFTLTRDCLITGTKQSFCSNETTKLTFILNGVITPDALEREINNDDTLTVTYGN